MTVVVGVDLHGRGDTQQFRLELPDVKVTKGYAEDSRIRVEMRRDFFNLMVEGGAKLPDWYAAFYEGKAKATGVRAVPAADHPRRREAVGAQPHQAVALLAAQASHGACAVRRSSSAAAAAMASTTSTAPTR